jgi:hypothetical protein
MLTTLKGNLVKSKAEVAWNWPLWRGALLIIKQTKDEADYVKGEIGKGKEDEAWSWPFYREALVKVKQTRHETDHPKGELW